LYAYAMNNPVRWVDPTGRFVIGLATSMAARAAANVATSRATSTTSGSAGVSQQSSGVASNPGGAFAGVNAAGGATTGVGTTAAWIRPLSNLFPTLTAGVANLTRAAQAVRVPGIGKAVAAATGVYLGILAAQVLPHIGNASEARTWALAQVATGGIPPGGLRNNSVYVLYNGQVFYVGRTINFTTRRNAHLRDPRFADRRDFDMFALSTGLNREDARALEQALIVAFTIEALDNKINSIAQANWDRFSDEFRRIQLLLSR
jgi:hypothetical protein